MHPPSPPPCLSDHFQPAKSGLFPKSWWWIFMLSVRRFEPYNIKPLRLFSTRVPRLWSMASSQDSEWSADWTTSGIWMLNNCPLNRGHLWIIHAAVRASHLLWPLAADALARRPVQSAEGQGANTWHPLLRHPAAPAVRIMEERGAKMEASDAARAQRWITTHSHDDHGVFLKEYFYCIIKSK